jgi:O-antigen ligase
MFEDSSKIRKLLISITWISFFFSINLNPVQFDTFNMLNKLRILSPFLLTITLIFLTKKINYSSLLKTDFLILNFIFLSYCFFNIYNTSNSNINLFWPFYMFLSLFFVVSILDQKEIKYLIKLTFLIILFGFIFYFSLACLQMYKTNNLNFYGIMGNNDGYWGFKNPPRSSGLARLSLILSSFLFLFLVLKNKIHYKKLLTLFIIIFSTITLLFSSRTASTIWIITFISIFFFYIKLIKNKLSILFFFFLIPITIASSYNFLKINYYKLEDKKKFSLINNFDINDVKNSVSYTLLRKTNNNFSSGRYQDWLKAFDILKENPILGYGPQGDRLLINQSIHNAFIYSLISAGVIGGILFLLVYLRTLYFFVKFLFDKSLYLNFNFSISIILIIILNLRSTLETSFAIYSIDYLIFILIFSNLSNYFSKKNE